MEKYGEGSERMEKDLDVLFRDSFLVHGMDKDPPIAQQIGEGRGEP
jgi:hypothetical protein